MNARIMRVPVFDHDQMLLEWLSVGQLCTLVREAADIR